MTRIALVGVALLGGLWASLAGGVEPPRPPAPPPEALPELSLASLRAAIASALPLLERGARGSLEQRKQCFTCHNQGLPILALTAARERGFTIDGEHLAEQVAFIAAFLQKNQQRFLTGKGTGGQVDTAGYALWALDRGGYAPDAVTTAVAEYLLLFPKEASHWQVGSQRPPSEASSLTTSFLALRGLARYATAEQQERAAKRRQAALEWFRKTKAQDNEDHVFRLRGLAALSAPADEIAAAASNLAARQCTNGGWAQRDDLPSDAYATSTALAALHEVGGLAAESPAYREGLVYLLHEQHADGSWQVASRSKPFQAYFESGYPHGKDQFISIMAGSWSVIALCHALPQEPVAP